MDYVVNDEKVHPGEAILTSGEDRIFPKGLPIGTVMDSSPGNSLSDNSREDRGAHWTGWKTSRAPLAAGIDPEADRSGSPRN